MFRLGERKADVSSAIEPAGHRNFGDSMRQAVALHQDRRFDDAIAVYRRILLMYPDNADALTYFGCALLEIGKAIEAVDRLHEAVAADPNSADALSYLGNALQVTGDWEAAEAAYRGALDLAPSECRTQNNLGVLLLELNRLDEAAESLRRGLSVDPNHVHAHNNICQVYTKLDEIDRAIESGRRAIEIAPRYADAHNSLGAALMKADRIDDAITEFRGAIAIQPRFLDALKNLALVLINAGKPREAVELTDTCLEVDPGNIEVLATRSVALNEAGDTDSLRALVDFDRLLQRIRIDPNPEFDGLAGFNDALARHIRSHPSLKFAPSDHATRGGMHSGDLLAEPKGPMAAFEQIVSASFDRYIAALPAGLEHPFLARKPSRWPLNIWGLVFPAQGYQVPHFHRSGWISGVYYVRVSGVVSDPNDGHDGWIEFGRPQSIYRTTAPANIHLVRPEERLMVLFPAFFFHRTIPFEAEADRICIAFDSSARFTVIRWPLRRNTPEISTSSILSI